MMSPAVDPGRYTPPASVANEIASPPRAGCTTSTHPPGCSRRTVTGGSDEPPAHGSAKGPPATERSTNGDATPVAGE